MKDGDALKLLEKKIGDRVDMVDALNLLRELDNMPLTLTQTAAYLKQMGRRCSVQKWLEKVLKGENSRKSILDEDVCDLSCD